MILVEVYVPALDKSYDFMLEENETVKRIIGEIGEMLSQKMKSPIPSRTEEFLLCNMDKNQILPLEKTLAGCHVKDGSRLLLV